MAAEKGASQQIVHKIEMRELLSNAIRYMAFMDVNGEKSTNENKHKKREKIPHTVEKRVKNIVNTTIVKDSPDQQNWQQFLHHLLPL